MCLTGCIPGTSFLPQGRSACGHGGGPSGRGAPDRQAHRTGEYTFGHVGMGLCPQSDSESMVQTDRVLKPGANRTLTDWHRPGADSDEALTDRLLNQVLLSDRARLGTLGWPGLTRTDRARLGSE